jgi:hypothetical protein
VIVGIAAVVVVAIVAVVLAVVLAGGDDDSKDTASGTGSAPGPAATVPGGSGPGGSGPGGSGSGDSSGSDEGDSGSGDSGSGDGESGDGGPSPEAMADEVARVVEQHDSDAIQRYACTEQQAAELNSELARLDGIEISAEVTDVQTSGDTAQADITMSAAGQSENFTIEMAQNDDGLWCVTGI